MNNYFLAANLNSFINPLIGPITGFASLLAVFMIVYGGLRYITSSGQPEKLALAKRTIIRSLIGLAIIIGASAISLILIHTYSSSTHQQVGNLPKIINVSPHKTSNGLIAIIIDAITGVLASIIQTIGSPFINALSYFVQSTPILSQNPDVMKLWLITSGLADSLLVLVIMLIGFHVMSAEQFGLRNVDLRSLLPQILLVFILMNSSIFILDGIIELSNALISAVMAVTGNILPWKILASLSTNLAGYSLASLFIFIIFIIFSAILIIYYLTRLVVLYIGAVLSPLVVLLALVPGFREFSENSFKAYVSTIFVIFIHVIILSLAGSLFLGAGVNHNSPLMALLLGLATLLALIKTQGVLRQLSYASVGPRMARQLGSKLIIGVSYLGGALKYATQQTYIDYTENKNIGNIRFPLNRPTAGSLPNNHQAKGGK